MSNPTDDLIGQFIHLDSDGNARMVDVGDKPVTVRTASAASRIIMSMEAAEAIRRDSLSKGNAISVSRIAALSAVKQTSQLIPLCHLVLIDGATVDFEWIDPKTLECRVAVRSTGRTGVEMEALTAASVAALSIYDMCKSIDRSMEIQNVRLLEKTGGQRGEFHRSE
jgi:cyclic pyranopterin phosphate synthase